jgi:hypothetical protein
VNTVDTADTSWLVGKEAVTGSSWQSGFWASNQTRERALFEWKGPDSDNSQAFINQILHEYCQREKSESTMSQSNRIA